MLPSFEIHTVRVVPSSVLVQVTEHAEPDSGGTTRVAFGRMATNPTLTTIVATATWTMSRLASHRLQLPGSMTLEGASTSLFRSDGSGGLSTILSVTQAAFRPTHVRSGFRPVQIEGS